VSDVEAAILKGFIDTDNAFLELAARDRIYAGSTANFLLVRGSASADDPVTLFCGNAGARIVAPLWESRLGLQSGHCHTHLRALHSHRVCIAWGLWFFFFFVVVLVPGATVSQVTVGASFRATESRWT